MTTLQDEVEAAELEGFYEVGHNAHLVEMYARYKELRRQEKRVRERKGQLGDKILEKLTELGATAFTIGGQVMMRKQVVEDSKVFDTERFKKDHPELYTEYRTKTKKGSIRAWVRPQNGDDMSEDDDAA